MEIRYSPERLDHGKIQCVATHNSLELVLQSADINGAGHHGDVVSNVRISLSGEAIAEVIQQIQEMKHIHS